MGINPPQLLMWEICRLWGGFGYGIRIKLIQTSILADRYKSDIIYTLRGIQKMGTSTQQVK